LVKGVSRRVIVIKTPDPKIFEEAIFIVRDDAGKNGVTQDELLREAQLVANDYIRKHIKRNIFARLPAPVFTVFGAAATGVVWLIMRFF
jgi:hypothetical protein